MAETISNHKKRILDQSGISEETAAFLEKIKVPLLQEWAYLCAAEGMQKDAIDRVCDKAAENMETADQVFLEEREKHLRVKYENNKALMERVTKLQGEVESMYKRASHVENSLDETIRKALREKDELYGKIIEGKEELLKDREKQIKEQKDQARAREERIRLLEDRLQTMESGQISPVEESIPAPGKEDKKGEEPLDRSASTVDDLLLSYYTPERNQIFIPRPARSLFQRRKDREAERFIRQFMEAGDYNDEQKEFLIRCLEQGDSLDFIREFASPNLSVEHMAWLRKIVGRRIRYGR